MLKEEKQILWRTSATFLGAAMPLLLIGRAVMAACLLFGLILGLVATKGHSLRSSIRYFTSSRIVHLGLAVLATYALATVFAINQEHSANHLIQMTGMGLFAFLLYLTLREMPVRHVHLMMQTLFVSTLVILLLAGLDAFLNDPRLSSALHGRKAGQLHRLNYMSSVFAVMLPFVWAWLIRRVQENEPLAMKLAIPFAALSFWVLFACGGRAGWVAGVVAASVFVIRAVSLGDLSMKLRHWLGLVVAVMVAPLAYGLARGFEFLQARLEIQSTIENGVTAYSGGSGRLDIWQFALDNMLINPFTGIGLNGFRNLPLPAYDIASNAHPHNFVLQLALETGALGLVVTLAFFVSVLTVFYKYAKGNLFGAAAFASLIAFFTASLFNTSIFQPWWLMFFVFAAVVGARIGWSDK